MKWHGRSIRLAGVIGLVCISILFTNACDRIVPDKKPPGFRPSDIKVAVNTGGPAVLTTSVAEFQVLPSGYLRASLVNEGTSNTLDEPDPGRPGDSDFIVSDGQEIHFILDFNQARVTEAVESLGRGKRVEIPGTPLGPSGRAVQKLLTIEAYDDFPNLLLTTVSYKNGGSAELNIDREIAQRHRFDSHASAGTPAYEMWSFRAAGDSAANKKEVKITRGYKLTNEMQAVANAGSGGNVPVIAFWTGDVGEAIGQMERAAHSFSMPVEVRSDSRVHTSVSVPINAKIKSGESFSTPRTFVCVYKGDYHEPLRLWNTVIEREGSRTKAANDSVTIHPSTPSQPEQR